MRKNIARVLLLSLTLSAISPMQDADAATKLTLSNKSISIKVGATKTVKANKTVKWKTSNKKIATVKKLSKKKAKITAKKAGSCKITAIAGKKKATIRVTVKKASKPTKKPTVTVKPTSTAKATSTPVSIPTAIIEPTPTAVVPTSSASPEVRETACPTATVSSSIVPEATEVVTIEPTATIAVITPEPTAVVASIEPTATTAVTTPEPTATVPASAEPIATSVVTATAVASTEPKATPAVTPISVSEAGIIMTLDSYENGKITYTIKNESDDDIQYKQYYSIEKQVNGEWVEVEPDRNTNVPMDIIDINRGSEDCITTDIKKSFDLTAGNYRFVKVLYSKNCKCAVQLKLPFEVTNTIVYQDGISMTLDSYKNGILEYTVENQSGDKIWYSIYEYAISKEVDGEWVTLAPEPYQPVPDVIESLENGEKESYTETMLRDFDITPGKYRFTLYFKNGVRLSLPFEITNTTVYQSGVSVVLGGYDNGALTYMITNQTGKKIRYSYEGIGEKMNNGELGVIKLYVPKTDGTDGEVEADMTKTNKVKLDLPSGNYYYLITITMEESDGANTQEFMLQLPFEVE